MVDISGVGGSSHQYSHGEPVQQIKQNLQNLDQQVGHCLKAVQESKEKLVENIMQNIEEIQQNLEQLKSQYPGSFSHPDMKDLMNQLHAITGPHHKVSSQDLNKLSVQLSVVKSTCF